jgi:predicted nucleotidyltransferase
MNKTLTKIVDYAVRIADPEKIILFGSMANGNSNHFSDIDLLIISENSFTKKEITAKIESFTKELSLKADILFYSGSEIEDELRRNNSFVNAIFKSGKIVYENKNALTLKD